MARYLLVVRLPAYVVLVNYHPLLRCPLGWVLMLSLLLLRVAEIWRSLKLQLLYLGLMHLMEGLLETTQVRGLAPKARLSRSEVLRVVSDMVGGSTNSSCFLCPIAYCLFVFSPALQRRPCHGLVGFLDLFPLCFVLLHICTGI